MDIVYTLGMGAAATNDWELRISLRSWAKFAGRWRGKFVIVGAAPDWLDTSCDEIVHIAHPDPYKSNKDANLIQKLIAAALHGEVSDPFVFCSDDQGPLSKVRLKDFEPFHSGRISDLKLVPEGEPHRGWQERLRATGDFLKSEGVKEPLHFDAHIPYLLTTDQVTSVIRSDYGAKPGYTVMSLIYGLTPPSGKPCHISDGRIRAGLYSAKESPSVVDDKLSKNRWYSLGGGSPDCWYLVAAMESLFDEPGKWEMDAKELIPRSSQLAHLAEGMADDAERVLRKLGYSVISPEVSPIKLNPRNSFENIRVI